MSDYQDRAKDEDDDLDELNDSNGYKHVKDAVLFAIEVNSSMLAKPQDYDERKPDTGLAPAIAALKCAYTLMQKRIISNPKDMMGILLFGTQKTKYADHEQQANNLQFPHCYSLVELDIPSAEDVKLVRELVNEEDEDAILQASKDDVSMANVLFCANQIFTTRAADFSSRRIFLVTDNDSPHSSSPDARKSAAVRANDLFDLDIKIDLFPISHPNRGFTFDRGAFYKDLLYGNSSEDPDAPAQEPAIEAAASNAADGISLLQKLLSAITSRAAPRRTLNKDLKFEVAPGLEIGVNTYVILKQQEALRNCFVYLPTDGDKPQIATSKSTFVAEDTARTVEKSELKKAFKFGGETVYFTPEELTQMKNFGEPVLRIIGFKPISMLPLWANHTKSTYMYPSEEQYVGSTRVFSALYQKLLNDQKMALAWYIARKNASPVIAAILPGEEKLGRDGQHLLSAGLWIKPLPFADDIREIESSKPMVPPEELVESMRSIVEQLKLPKSTYDMSKYPNPALQWFYKILQALALEEDQPTPDADKTLPAFRQIFKRSSELAVTWNRKYEAAYAEWLKTNTSRYYPSATAAVPAKRATTSTSTNGAKRIKTEDGAGPDDSEFRKAYDQQTLIRFTVPQLKSFALTKGLPTAGKKNDLIEAITDFFERK